MKRIFQVLMIAATGFIGLSLWFVILYKWLPVPFTPLMVIRSVQQVSDGKPVKLNYDWVSGKHISTHLKLAVICAEDQNFANHKGFDLEAIDKAIKESKSGRRRLRGASTISQQTAKNLFLWPGRSWVRKGFEVWFTGLIELFWSKERILHVYLNIIEMGDGIYGAQAASGSYFKIPAAKLSRYQAAAIAAILPNPRRYNAANPGPYIAGRISWVQDQMLKHGSFDLK